MSKLFPNLEELPSGIDGAHTDRFYQAFKVLEDRHVSGTVDISSPASISNTIPVNQSIPYSNLVVPVITSSDGLSYRISKGEPSNALSYEGKIYKENTLIKLPSNYLYNSGAVYLLSDGTLTQDSSLIQGQLTIVQLLLIPVGSSGNLFLFRPSLPYLAS